MASSSSSTSSSSESESVEEEARTISTYLESIYSKRSPCPSLRSTYPPHSVQTLDFQDSSSVLLKRPTNFGELSTSDSKLPSKAKKLPQGFKREFSRMILMVDMTDDPSDSSREIEILRYFTNEDTQINGIESITSLKRENLPKVTNLITFNELLNLPIDKNYINEICFGENLIISLDTSYNKHKKCNNIEFEIFPKQKHLLTEFSERVGVFCLRIEQVNEYIVTYCNSQLTKNDNIAGTQITSVILKDFTHVDETKIEFEFVDNIKIEKKLQIEKENDNYKITLKHKGCSELRNREGELKLLTPGNLLQDGGIYVLMRFLVLTEFVGNLEFWAMDINGKIGLCKMDIGQNRTIFINNQVYKTIRIKKTFLRYCIKPDISKTYFLPTGHIIQHKWKGCPYYLHLNDYLILPPQDFTKKSDWMNDILLSAKYDDEKTRILQNIEIYLDENDEMKNLLHDYIEFLKLVNPDNMSYYTIQFFLNLIRKKDEKQSSQIKI